MRIGKICLEEQFNYDDVSESELKIIFEKRLEEAKEKSVFEPFCIPYSHSNSIILLFLFVNSIY